HESEVKMLQIAQSAVDEAGRPGRRAVAEVLLFDQSGAQAAQSRVAGNRRTVDAAADNQHVVFFRCHLLELTLHAFCLHMPRRGSNMRKTPRRRSRCGGVSSTGVWK